VMDGLDATRRLRQAGYTAPIIALTAHAMGQDRQTCLDAGCDGYLTKPCGRNELLAAIAGYLDRKEPLPGDTETLVMNDPIEAPTPVDDPRVRILLAEDTPDIQLLTSILLKEAGADVTAVGNGQQAVEKALAARSAGQPFALILMDMQMPVMDGFDATRRLRQEGYEGRIVALTAHSMAADRQECLSAGCDDFLTKPVAPDRLAALVSAAATAEPSGSGPDRDATATAPARGIEEVLQSQYADRPAVARVLGEFVSRLDGRIQAMQAALGGSQADELRRLAHQLKGASGSYGFPTLSAAAKVLEDEARLARWEPAAEALNRVVVLSKAVLNGWEISRTAAVAGTPPSQPSD
jgi:CheY-like chemotaxis protein/HPt (histidine-containing phosphotransfer) domain-containing protein